MKFCENCISQKFLKFANQLSKLNYIETKMEFHLHTKITEDFFANIPDTRIFTTRKRFTTGNVIRDACD